MDRKLEEMITKAVAGCAPSVSEEILRGCMTEVSLAQSMAGAMKQLESEYMLAAIRPVSESVFGMAKKGFPMTAWGTADALTSMELERIALKVSGTSTFFTTSELERMAFNASAHTWLESSAIEELRRSLEPGAAVREFMKQETERQKAFEEAFRLPSASEYANLAANAVASSRLAGKVFSGFPGTLGGMMAGMDEAWLSISDAHASAVAFADIQAIGHFAALADPFDDIAGAAIRANLGDWRDTADFPTERYADPIFRSGKYLEHGFDPSLTDFPVPAFERAVEIAGLDTPGGGEDANLESNTRAYNRLLQFEIEIRRFIVAVMHGAFGESWMKRQLPTGMLDRWMAKKETAEKAGGPELLPIEYADFPEYKAIIERKDNWDKVFKHVFGRQEDVRESFQRLLPVRIATMHSRIITLDDNLLLLVETRRILGAIKKSNGKFLSASADQKRLS